MFPKIGNPPSASVSPVMTPREVVVGDVAHDMFQVKVHSELR